MKRLRQVSSLFVILAYVLNIGCSSVRTVPMSNDVKSGDKVHGVTLISGEIIEFDDDGGMVNSYRGTIDGKTRQGKDISVKLDNVKSVRTAKTDITDTFIWTVVSIGVLIGAFSLLVSFPDL